MIPMWKLGGRLGNQMFQYAYLFAQVKRGEIPDIYLQSEEYFEDYNREIKAIFSTGIGHLDQVSIHVRRGDYVNNPFYTDLFESGYYEEAMEMFPDANFLVFSDDIAWCKRQPLFEECEFSEGNDEVTDLNLMASCQHNIIANSSFSWWAAYLNPNPNKKVIAPALWHPDGLERTVLPANWITI